MFSMKSIAIVIASLALAGPSALAAANKSSDAEVVGALKIINIEEIAAADDALSRATNEDVKDFAQEMAKDHAEANKRIAQFVDSERIAPQEGSVAWKFRAKQAEDRTIASVHQNESYDRVYIDQQVQGHQAVLAMIDQESGGRSPALTRLLKDTRKRVSRHLQEAKKIQSRLTSAH